MRNFQLLDKAAVDSTTGVMTISADYEHPGQPILALRREGGYVVISASYGPLELAMRPRFHEFSRVLARLQPVEGLQTTRQVGTGEAYISLGLQTNGTLLLRLTIVGDATGHLSFNLAIADGARKALFEWLPAGAPEEDV
jgi:hypothetical protein